MLLSGVEDMSMFVGVKTLIHSCQDFETQSSKTMIDPGFLAYQVDSPFTCAPTCLVEAWEDRKPGGAPGLGSDAPGNRNALCVLR